jgi:ParB family chromosome partitioning protein
MSPSKLTLNPSQDIPFNKLTLSQANVRRVKAGLSIEALADDIARRGLLQSLNVRPVLGADGAETGAFEVPAGGRRFRALGLLVKQKRLAKTAPIPCIVSRDGLAVEDSLAENVLREGLHPLDQFRAFSRLAEEEGQGVEAIAATFGVTPAVVRQRLKLAAASPKLLDLYASDKITLDQLVAFCVTGDHARQETVWEAIKAMPDADAHRIRRMLTEGAVRDDDRRARLIGAQAYEAAGGVILRDLFDQGEASWFEDAGLLDRLVAEALSQVADEVRAEGWKWVEHALDFGHGASYRFRRLPGAQAALTPTEETEHQALLREYEEIHDTYANCDDIPDHEAERLDSLEAALAAFENRPMLYDPAGIAIAGARISLNWDGDLKIERGLVRPEDEPQAATETEAMRRETGLSQGHAAANGAATADPGDPDEAGAASTKLPDRLVADLTAQQTLVLRDRLAASPEIAQAAVLHALALAVFYTRGGTCTCLEIEARPVTLDRYEAHAGLAHISERLDKRHAQWMQILPTDPGDLWASLLALDAGARAELLAYCAALTVNAVSDPWHGRPAARGHATALGRAVSLDMAEAGWTATAAAFLGRVTKTHILQAVREARGEQAVSLIDHLKKQDMAREGERLLEGCAWLPSPLRTEDPDRQNHADETAGAAAVEAGDLPAFLIGETASGAEEHAPAMAAE